MKNIILIFLISLLHVNFSCAKKDVAIRQGELELKLNQCATGNIAGNDISLCFEKVETDNRCPADVMCIWSGVAACLFAYTINNQTGKFVLATGSVQGMYRKDTVVAGFKFEMINLDPYPEKAGVSIPDYKRKAKVNITKL